MGLFSPYSIRARFMVGLFYIFPLFLDCIVIYRKELGTILPMFLYASVALLCQALSPFMKSSSHKFPIPSTARDLLMPTGKLSADNRARYYRKLSVIESEFAPFGIAVTTDDYSQITPSLCTAAVDYLRAKTRDSEKYPLVYETNINYGFLRNAVNFKTLGLILNFVALLFLFQGYQLRLPAISTRHAVLLGVQVLWIILIAVKISKAELLRAEKSYAYALLETIDTII